MELSSSSQPEPPWPHLGPEFSPVDSPVLPSDPRDGPRFLRYEHALRWSFRAFPFNFHSVSRSSLFSLSSLSSPLSPNSPSIIILNSRPSLALSYIPYLPLIICTEVNINAWRWWSLPELLVRWLLRPLSLIGISSHAQILSYLPRLPQPLW